MWSSCELDEHLLWGDNQRRTTNIATVRTGIFLPPRCRYIRVTGTTQGMVFLKGTVYCCQVVHWPLPHTWRFLTSCPIPGIKSEMDEVRATLSKVIDELGDTSVHYHGQENTERKHRPSGLSYWPWGLSSYGGRLNAGEVGTNTPPQTTNTPYWTGHDLLLFF